MVPNHVPSTPVLAFAVRVVAANINAMLHRTERLIRLLLSESRMVFALLM